MLPQILCCIKFYDTDKYRGLVTRQENEAKGFPPKLPLWFVNMTESEEGKSPVEFSTAINLLRQATNILSGLNSPANATTTSTTSSSKPTTSNHVSLRLDFRYLGRPRSPRKILGGTGLSEDCVRLT